MANAGKYVVDKCQANKYKQEFVQGKVFHILPEQMEVESIAHGFIKNPNQVGEAEKKKSPAYSVQNRNYGGNRKGKLEKIEVDKAFFWREHDKDCIQKELVMANNLSASVFA